MRRSTRSGEMGWFLVFLLMLMMTSTRNSVVAYTGNRPAFRGGGKTRYFTKTLMLPSLASEGLASNSTLLSYTRNSWGKPIPCTYTNDPRSLCDWLGDKVGEEYSTLGFDVELNPKVPWRRDCSFYGPATVQLATPDDAIVVHLVRSNARRLSSTCWPILEAVMGDPTIIKTGVGLDDDMLALYGEFCGSSNGHQGTLRLDLGGLKSPRDGVFDRHQTAGLKKLAKSILGVQLSKPRKLATSDWSRVPLKDKQIAYGARDAWVGAAVVAELEKRDSKTFGTVQLVDIVARRERPLSDVSHSRRKRREAKNELRRLTKGQRWNPQLYPPESIFRRTLEKQISIIASNPADVPLALEIPEGR